MKADESLKAAVSMMLSDKFWTRTKDMALKLGHVNDKGEPLDRKVRMAIHDLRADGNAIIFSTKGVKLAESVAEIDANITSYRSYIRSLAIDMRGLKRARVTFAGQIKMEI